MYLIYKPEVLVQKCRMEGEVIVPVGVAYVAAVRFWYFNG